jgi:hypothetical protein
LPAVCSACRSPAWLSAEIRRRQPRTYHAGVPERRKYSDEELEAAVQAISDPERLEQAQRVVTSTAPQLQRIFDEALSSAEWYGSARRAEVVKAAGTADADQRMDAVGRLVDEETRVSMLIGVAVGFELAHQLIERANDRHGS